MTPLTLSLLCLIFHQCRKKSLTRGVQDDEERSCQTRCQHRSRRRTIGWLFETATDRWVHEGQLRPTTLKETALQRIVEIQRRSAELYARGQRSV